MKKTIALFVACAAAALALVSCQKVNNAPASVAKTVHFTAQTLDTKTAFGANDAGFYPTLWTANDENVKILVNTGSPVVAPVTPSVVDFKTATFNAELADDGSGSYTFYAVSPASAFGNFNSSYKNFNVTVSGNQTPSATSADEAAMLIAAKSSVYEPSFPTSVDLAFLHATAYGKLTLTNLATVGGETIKTVKLTLPAGEDKWTGSGFYYVDDYDTHTAGDLVPASTASKELLINTNSASDIWFACMPTKAMGGEDIEVLVTTNKSTYTRTITLPDGKNFEAGVIAEFTVDMTSAVKETAPVYSLIPAAGSNNSYAGNCDVEIDGITWNITGNSQMLPWRIGGKNLNNVNRAVYSKTAIENNISQIVITHGAASNVTVNSMKVYVCSTAEGAAADTPTDVVAELTPAFVASGDVTIDKTDATSWANCYYRIVYNVTIGGSNKYIQFSEAKFYE